MRPVARIAQSVEQGIENPRVLGSIPSSGTTILKASQKCGALSFLGPWSIYGRQTLSALHPSSTFFGLSQRFFGKDVT